MGFVWTFVFQARLSTLTLACVLTVYTYYNDMEFKPCKCWSKWAIVIFPSRHIWFDLYFICLFLIIFDSFFVSFYDGWYTSYSGCFHIGGCTSQLIVELYFHWNGQRIFKIVVPTIKTHPICLDRWHRRRYIKKTWTERDMVVALRGAMGVLLRFCSALTRLFHKWWRIRKLTSHGGH